MKCYKKDILVNLMQAFRDEYIGHLVDLGTDEISISSWDYYNLELLIIQVLKDCEA